MTITVSPPRLAITYRRLDELTLDPLNPRKHSNGQQKRIGRSIEKFGFNVPILIDETGRVIAGHGRVLACRRLGWTEVPTIRLDHMDERQVRLFMIADNRLTELGSWDEQLLAQTFQELSSIDLELGSELDLELSGFDMGEIDLLIAGPATTGQQSDPDDLVPEAVPGPAVSLPGDLWQLGRHRLLCGSALEATAYTTLMAGKQAAMVFTDPPYNVPIDGHVSGLGATKHREFAMASGEMTSVEFLTFLTDALRLMAAHSCNGSLHYICMDWRHMGEVLAAGTASYAELKNLCVWSKHNGGMGSFYRSQHELVFVYKHGQARHRNNVELGRHGRNRSNVWSYPGANTFGRGTEEGNLSALHPTVKPVLMVADAILDCTARGDIVLDPFLGSGTTLMAAERTGRSCYGLELDPLYVDVIIRRWQRHSGDKARHAGTGRSFDDVLASGGCHE